jgi:hypothetical protein
MDMLKKTANYNKYSENKNIRVINSTGRSAAADVYDFLANGDNKQKNDYYNKFKHIHKYKNDKRNIEKMKCYSFEYNNELPSYICQPVSNLYGLKFVNNSERDRFIKNNKIMNRLKMTLKFNELESDKIE